MIAPKALPAFLLAALMAGAAGVSLAQEGQPHHGTASPPAASPQGAEAPAPPGPGVGGMPPTMEMGCGMMGSDAPHMQGMMGMPSSSGQMRMGGMMGGMPGMGMPMGMMPGMGMPMGMMPGMGMPMGMMPGTGMPMGMVPGMGMPMGQGAEGMAGEDPAAAALAAVNRRMHREMAGPPSGDVDVDFVRAMIAHHRGAVDMARVVLAFGDDPEIRKLSEQIIAAQTQEIQLMEAWLARARQ